jgi:hypothetical protein
MSTFHELAVRFLLALMVVSEVVTFSVWLYFETAERVERLINSNRRRK